MVCTVVTHQDASPVGEIGPVETHAIAHLWVAREANTQTHHRTPSDGHRHVRTQFVANSVIYATIYDRWSNSKVLIIVTERRLSSF